VHDEDEREEEMQTDSGDLRFDLSELGESIYVIAMPRNFPWNKLASTI